MKPPTVAGEASALSWKKRMPANGDGGAGALRVIPKPLMLKDALFLK